MIDTTPSQMPLSKTQKTSDIPSLLVPIVDKLLMLPTVSVAEMLPYRKPSLKSEEIGQMPPWFLGHVKWRGISIPMISYEAINGGAIADIKAVSQMSVLNSTGVHPKLPFLCFPTQSIPRLSRVSPDNIKEESNAQLEPYDKMHVMVNDIAATIPNVSKLEEAVVELLKLS